MKNVRVGNFFGGLPIKQQRDMLKDKDKCPHIIVGTPGRIKGVRAQPCPLALSCCVAGAASRCGSCRLLCWWPRPIQLSTARSGSHAML
jgi:hypothetical protein